MQHARAHVRKLAKLGIGNTRNRLRIIDDARVGCKEAGNVSPVLIQVGAQALSHNRARDISAAAVEQLDFAIFRRAIEARKHEALFLADRSLELFGSLIHIDRAIGAERNNVGRIDEREAQVFSHHAAREVFAAAHDILRRVFSTLRELTEDAEFMGNGVAQIQLFGNFAEALADSAQKVIACHVVLQVSVHQIQQVGNFAVELITLAGGAHDDKTARGVGLDDCLDFFELAGRAHARAAELRNLDHRTTFDAQYT